MIIAARGTQPAALENRFLGEGLLALADGTLFRGLCFGAKRGPDSPVIGEVVFNTSMYGYQEILSDPSYAGQIICFTYPHIGNVGCNDEDWESGRIWTEGVIVRDLSRVVSNFRAGKSLSRQLEEAGIMGICGLDTRALVRHIRDTGAQMGAIAVGRFDPATLVDAARSAGGMSGRDYVRHVTCEEPYTWHELPWRLRHGFGRELSEEALCARPHIVAIDCGIKYNILRLLIAGGFRVTVVPANWSADQIMALQPDAIFLSNGPGDPAALPYVVRSVSALLGKLPLFGICLGHQILAQAVGARTYKLKFGHRGGNHPVKNLHNERVEITVQNHGFCVEEKSIPREVRVSHVNLNDGTNEGIDVPELRAFSVQYHPEASPGPHDALYNFKRFFEMVVTGGGSSSGVKNYA